MEVQFTLNGKKVSTEIAADTVLLNLLRDLGCKSVKCGCETTNCGLCTVWIDGKSRLSCSVLAASIDGHEVTTLEGVEKEAAEFGSFLAQEGAEQCGFCSPGFIMNVLAMFLIEFISFSIIVGIFIDLITGHRPRAVVMGILMVVILVIAYIYTAYYR